MTSSKVLDRQAAIAARKTLVYLVRHGETSWNVEKRFQGQLDVELSEKGKAQARAVADWLAGQPVEFAALYSSDLKRAIETARIIGAKVGLIPHLDPALREINAGEWQGLIASEIEERFPGKLDEWHRKIDSFTVPGGESVSLVQKRVYAAYEQIVSNHPGEAIIIVSHGAALTALLAALHGWDLVETWHTKRARMGNTHVTVVALDHQESRHEMLLMDSAEHLDTPAHIESTRDAKPGTESP